MSPVVFLVVGLLVIWLVFSGRALATWEAITAGQTPVWAKPVEPTAPVETPGTA